MSDKVKWLKFLMGDGLMEGVRVWSALPFRLFVILIHKPLFYLWPLSRPEQGVVKLYTRLWGKNGVWHDRYAIEHWPEWLQ